MTSSRRLSAVGPKTRIALGLAGVLVLVAALFDWNWVRGPLARHLTEKSGREVRIGHLDVNLGLALQPIVRLRDLHIENAPWAAQQPMIDAKEAVFTFALRSLWERRPVILRLVLRDARVDIERHADGRRNWRLLDPEERGPGRVRVQTLEAYNSRLRFVHGAIDLEVVAEATPLAPVTNGAVDANALTTQFAIKGSYRGTRFAAEALTGAVVSFRDSDFRFPIRGHAVSGKTRVDIDGTAADILDLSFLDAKVRAAGASLSHWHPFVAFRPALSRPYQVDADITHAQSVYTVARLRGKIGTTDLAGEGSFDRNPDRPLLKVALKSESADLADLGSLAGISYRRGARAAVSRAEADAQQAEPTDEVPDRAGRIFSQFPLHGERLKVFDAHVSLHARKLVSAEMPALDSLRFTAHLADGTIKVQPFEIGVAGGQVDGSLDFNGRQRPASAQTAFAARNIRLERLIPSLAARAQGIGPLKAQVRLAGQGGSVAAILGHASGSLSAAVDRGSISNRLDAKLALNVGKLFALLFRGDQEIALHCAAVAFDVRNGLGKARRIVLDTAQTHIEGTGTINLRDERLDLLLTPQPKNPGIFTLRSSIRINGTFKNPDYALDPGVAPGGGGVARAGGGACPPLAG